MSQPLDVLYEDNHLLVVNKPAGLVTQGALPGEPSLVEQARAYLKHKYHKPGNVYLGVVSRLDAAVSGAVVLARTSKAAARLTEQFRNRLAEKTYWAVVEGSPVPAVGELNHWLMKDDLAQQTRVVSPGTPHAQNASLRYRTLERLAQGTLVEIELHTGRKHQIRAQFSAAGHAVLGDRKYGAHAPFASGIALHSRRLAIVHPTQPQSVAVVAPLPAAWKSLGLSTVHANS